MNGKNNPRVFAETITLDAWRTAFDKARGEADLHIDVVFSERGRIGGGGSPVRFRLSLKRAEVRVIRDGEEIIQIKPDSVMRSELPEPGKSKITLEKTGSVGACAGVDLSPAGVTAKLKANAEGKAVVTERFERTRLVPVMQLTHWKTDDGYMFRIESSKKGLDGQPWQATTPVMKLHDTNAARSRGEPPEIRVEIHCLREDLLIENVEFTDRKYPIWSKLPHKKRIAVEQFIKDELARAGLPCGDLSEPFTRIILADAMPSVLT